MIAMNLNLYIMPLSFLLLTSFSSNIDLIPKDDSLNIYSSLNYNSSNIDLQLNLNSKNQNSSKLTCPRNCQLCKADTPCAIEAKAKYWIRNDKNKRKYCYSLDELVEARDKKLIEQCFFIKINNQIDGAYNIKNGKKY